MRNFMIVLVVLGTYTTAQKIAVKMPAIAAGIAAAEWRRTKQVSRRLMTEQDRAIRRDIPWNILQLQKMSFQSRGERQTCG